MPDEPTTRPDGGQQPGPVMPGYTRAETLRMLGGARPLSCAEYDELCALEDAEDEAARRGRKPDA